MTRVKWTPASRARADGESAYSGGRERPRTDGRPATAGGGRSHWSPWQPAGTGRTSLLGRLCRHGHPRSICRPRALAALCAAEHSSSRRRAGL